MTDADAQLYLARYLKLDVATIAEAMGRDMGRELVRLATMVHDREMSDTTAFSRERIYVKDAAAVTEAEAAAIQAATLSAQKDGHKGPIVVEGAPKPFTFDDVVEGVKKLETSNRSRWGGDGRIWHYADGAHWYTLILPDKAEPGAEPVFTLDDVELSRKALVEGRFGTPVLRRLFETIHDRGMTDKARRLQAGNGALFDGGELQPSDVAKAQGIDVSRDVPNLAARVAARIAAHTRREQIEAVARMTDQRPEGVERSLEDLERRPLLATMRGKRYSRLPGHDLMERAAMIEYPADAPVHGDVLECADLVIAFSHHRGQLDEARIWKNRDGTFNRNAAFSPTAIVAALWDILDQQSAPGEPTIVDKLATANAGLHHLVRQLFGALVWCSGSSDFDEGGVAREGWARLVAPLLARSGDFFAKGESRCPNERPIHPTRADNPEKQCGHCRGTGWAANEPHEPKPKRVQAGVGITVRQDFKELDPDRIAEVFKAELEKALERRFGPKPGDLQPGEEAFDVEKAAREMEEARQGRRRDRLQIVEGVMREPPEHVSYELWRSFLGELLDDDGATGFDTAHAIEAARTFWKLRQREAARR